MDPKNDTEKLRAHCGTVCNLVAASGWAAHTCDQLADASFCFWHRTATYRES